MFQVVEQTREEKIAMYMKYTKAELASMLAQRDMVDKNRPVVVYQFPEGYFDLTPNSDIACSL